MWSVPITRLLAMAVMALPSPPAKPASNQGLPEPIVTRQSVFAIPYRVDQPTSPGQGPVEVRLFVSGDLGKTWFPCDKQPPAAGQFVFRAQNDGQYWFAISTLDRSGQVRPEKPETPGLRVIVDTVPPKMQLTATRGPAGQITARWTINEPNPRPESLVIQFRADPNGPWQEVAVPRERTSTTGPVQTSEVAWWPQAGSAAVQVRAEVTDQAGNPAVSHAQAGSPAGNGPAPAQTAQGGPPTPSAAATNGAAGQWRASGPDPAPVPWPPDSAKAGLSAQTGVPGAQAPPSAGQPNAPYVSHPSSPQGPGDRGPSRGAPSGQGTTQSLYPSTSAPPVGVAGGGAPAGQGPSSPPIGPVVNEVHPAIRDPYVSSGQRASDPGPGSLPRGHRPRMVNSRLFELDYDVQSVGPSGVSRVELWGTRDGGRHWQSVTLDDDNRSPLLVSLEQEGIYGLKVVVHSGAGLGSQPPQSGDLPDVWIGVDLTQPVARITGAEQGTGPESGHLIVSWQADDKMLAERPISLLVGPSPGGPWTPIATGLPNTGRYAWPIDQRAPDKVYLRLEARDEAGNVGSYETSASILIDRTRPSVLIRDVRPLGQSGQRQPNPYYRSPSANQ